MPEYSRIFNRDRDTLIKAANITGSASYSEDESIVKCPLTVVEVYNNSLTNYSRQTVLIKHNPLQTPGRVVKGSSIVFHHRTNNKLTVQSNNYVYIYPWAYID